MRNLLGRRRRCADSSECTSSPLGDIDKAFLSRPVDDYPPLKSARQGVDEIRLIAERRPSSDSARGLLDLCAKNLKIIEDSVPDLSAMTHGMQMEVEKFDKLVHETKQALDSNRIKRFLHLNGKNKERLSLLKYRLEEAHDNISAAAHDCLQRSADSSSHTSSAPADIIKTFLTVLNETAVAFPPLKSITAGVLKIWCITERVKALRDNAQHLEERYDIIFDIIHKIPDLHAVPPEMQKQIAQFVKLRNDTKPKLRSIQEQKGWTRLTHLNRYEKRLSTFDLRLKEAREDITFSEKVAMNTNSGVKPRKVGTRRKFTGWLRSKRIPE